MDVRTLLNLLQRFPGAANVKVDGKVCVGGVCLVLNGRSAKLKKDTKGPAGIVGLDDKDKAAETPPRD